MIYNETSSTCLLGEFNTGDSVTITVIDIITDQKLTLLTNVCSESANIPGLFRFLTSNISNKSTQMAYSMTNGARTCRGKFLFDNSLSTTQNEKLVNIPTDVWSYEG